jgi:hypothetical protein
MLVVPENVHDGSPPFLKCGLASAAETAMAAVTHAAPMKKSILRIRESLLSRIDPPTR